jgi:hypothetical protein
LTLSRYSFGGWVGRRGHIVLEFLADGHKVKRLPWVKRR